MAKTTKPCPIYGCSEQIWDNHLMCSRHFKMMPRTTQCDFFGMKKKVADGEEPMSKLIQIGDKAVQEVAETVASRRAKNRTAIDRMRASLA